MEKIICRRSQWSSYVILGLSLLLLGSGFFMVVYPDAFVETIPRNVLMSVAWTDIAVFSLCALGIVILLVKLPATQVIIDKTGIYSFRCGTIPWDGIIWLYKKDEDNTELLCIELHEPYRYDEFREEFLPAPVEQGGGVHFAINLTGLKPSLAEVWKYIQTHYPEKVRQVQD